MKENKYKLSCVDIFNITEKSILSNKKVEVTKSIRTILTSWLWHVYGITRHSKTANLFHRYL